jgi:predicted RND superfamily exporter protein
LESLLPDASPAAAAYGEYLRLFGGVRRVFVILQAPEDTDDVGSGLLTEAGDRLAELLEKSGEVSSARAGIGDEDQRQFLTNVVQRAPFLVPGADWLDKVAAHLDPEAIHDRVLQIRASLLTPGGATTARLAVHDPLGFAAELPLLQELPSGIPVDPITLGFVSPDGRSALVVAEPSAAELDAVAGQRLQKAIQEAAATIRQEFEADLMVRAVGGPLYAAHDEEVIRSDMERTLGYTALLCGGLLVAVFGGPAIPVAGLVALAAALTWLAAGIALTAGSVTAVAVGFSAVLVGLGLDTAIHGGAALRRRQLEATSSAEALEMAFDDVARPVVAAAVTTAAAFGVLIASDLPPLRELGGVVAGGMVTVVVSTATLGAGLALLLARKPKTPGWAWTVLGRGVDTIVQTGRRWPRVVLASALVLTVLTLPAAFKLEIQPDLTGLRPLNHPVLEAERVLREFFGVGEDTATVLVRGDDLDEALTQAEAVNRELAQSGSGVSVISPVGRVIGPAAAAERLEALGTLPLTEAVATFESESRSAGLAPTVFAPGLAALMDLADGEIPVGTLPIADEQLRVEPSGEVWVAMLLRQSPGMWPDGPPAEIRTALTRVAPSALVASVPWVGEDLRRVAASDLRRLSGLSLLLVVGVVLASFRGRPAPSLLALGPVFFGTAWCLGLWSLMGRPLDLVGLAVLPVMLGIGIDDGLHAVHGARPGGVERIEGSVRRPGPAMTLTTITTCVGFSSLALSRLPALQAVALLIPIGVGSCLVATLVLMPATASLIHGRE